MPKKGSEIVDIEVTLVHQTDDAWLVTTDGAHKAWIPKSVGELDGTTLTLPRSWAEDKELV